LAKHNLCYNDYGIRRNKNASCFRLLHQREVGVKLRLKAFAVLAASLLVIVATAMIVVATPPADNVQRYEIILNANPSLPPNNNVQRYNLEIGSPTFISLSNSQIDLAVTPNVQAQTYDTLTVTTNASNGYDISLSSDGQDLVCTADSSQTIANLPTPSGLSNDTWGYNHSLSAATPTTWQPVPADDTIITSPSPSQPAGDNYYLHFGVKVSFATPACIYQQALIITGVENI
jgi:hypothetical protein